MEIKGSKKTILIIDDEEDLRETLEYQLRAKNFNVVTAVDGLDGLEKLKDLRPDLIILDVNMPRMNGIEFYEKIKGDAAKPPYPVLILTARANMEQCFRDLDVDGFMVKPFDLQDLTQEATAIIQRNSSIYYQQDGTTRPRRVFLVDSDADRFTRLTVAFLDLGYTVNAARSGAQAIKRVEMAPPDVVVASLDLKDISGDMVLLKLASLKEKERFKSVLYTVRTAHIAEVRKRMQGREGMDAFVEMILPQDVLTVVDGLFKNR